MRIPFVDDEKTLLDQLKRALEDLRYMVETALDGQEALDKLFETPYDLIILGIMLPKKEGYPSCGKFGRRTFPCRFYPRIVYGVGQSYAFNLY